MRSIDSAETMQPRMNSSPKSEKDFLMASLNASTSHTASGRRIARQSYLIFPAFLFIQRISDSSARLAPEKYRAIILGAMKVAPLRKFASMRFSVMVFNVWLSGGL